MRASSIVRDARVDLVTLGESMVLLWPQAGETLAAGRVFEKSFGGAESNLCIALARLGHRTRWISRLGDDPFGRYIHDALEAEGVEVVAERDSAAPTAVFFKERNISGPRRVFYYRSTSAASRMRPEMLNEEMIATASVLHLTGITPALSTGCARTVDRAIHIARQQAVPISFDPNIRLQLWASPDTCRERLLALLRNVDVVLLGHEDSEVLFPGVGEDEALTAVRALGPEIAILKLGERGAYGARGTERIRVEAVPAEVVDVVGAGDGFDAGFLSGMLRGYSLEECLRLGTRIGAAAVSAAGDWEGYPLAEDLALLQ